VTAPARRARGPVDIAEQAFALRGGHVLTDGLEVTGLVFPDRLGDLVVVTGIAAGTVDVAVERLPTPPPAPDLSAWDEIIEVTLATEGIGPVTVQPVLGGADPNLVVIDTLSPHRLRVHAQGRDDAYDLVRSPSTETYLLQVWPSDDDELHVWQERDDAGRRRRAATARRAARAARPARRAFPPRAPRTIPSPMDGPNQNTALSRDSD
jgi:hypothetical protein